MVGGIFSGCSDALITVLSLILPLFLLFPYLEILSPFMVVMFFIIARRGEGGGGDNPLL